LFTTLKNAWKIPDLRKKMLFTLFMLIVYRLGANIPIPFINADYIKDLFNSDSNGLLGMFDLMSGGAFKRMTIFALNIYPYVTASIIIQLLTIAIPRLEALSREGEEGRKKLAQFTRYGTVIFALIQAIGISVGLFNQAIIEQTFGAKAIVIITMTAGTAFLMWLGEQITENGIGNGISLIIFIGIIAQLPMALLDMGQSVISGNLNPLQAALFLVLALGVIAGIVAIQDGSRKIPVQYAKRVVGRKMYGGQSTHIPLKVLMAGVIPVIFSTSLLAFPQTLAFFFDQQSGFTMFVQKWLTQSSTPGIYVYSTINVLLIIFFTYFYTAIQFNPVDYANNLKQYGGFIPGVRPGKPTADYLNRVLSRITIVGALSLAVISNLPAVLTTLAGYPIGFGGTGLLIVVGVALETVKQVESQMLTRHYKGFLN